MRDKKVANKNRASRKEAVKKDGGKNPNDTRIEKRAVGLSYRENPQRQNANSKAYNPQAAPKVIAKGFNEVAEEMIALAKKHQVLVHEDPELAEFLSRLDVGDEIPKELYVIVAELIAFVTWLDLKA